MRLARALVLGALLLPATAIAAPFPTRPFTASEALEKLIDESDRLVLARVLTVDETVRTEEAKFDPAIPAYIVEAMKLTPTRLRGARLRVVAWLNGGDSTEALDVITVEGGGNQVPEPAGWRALAGDDTRGALIALVRRGDAWALRGDPAAGLDAGFRAVPAADFRALADSCTRLRAGLVIDSLLARADLVVVAAPSTDPAALPTQVAVERVLAGAVPAGDLVLRSPRARIRPGRRLMALRHAADGAWEPVLFHRLAWWAPVDSSGRPDITPEAVEPEVRAALARLAKAGRGPSSRGASSPR